MFLYVITNLVNGKRYVGIATDFERRRKEHIRGHGSVLVYRAIQKYGLDNIDFAPLVEGPDAVVKDLEIRMIEIWETFGPEGYNLTGGGGGKLNCKHTLATKRKISASHKGKTLSMEHRQHISGGSRHAQMSDTLRQKLIESNRSRVFTPEIRQNMREAQLGKHDGGDNARAIPVTVNGVHHPCLKEAAKYLGISYGTLNRAKRKAGSSTFTYQPRITRVVVNGVSYDTLKNAAKAMGIKYGTLKDARRRAGSNTFTYQPKGVLTPITSE